MNTIRKGATVRYIGDNELAKGQTFRVRKRTGSLVQVAFPIRYLGGEVHASICDIPIENFELVKEERGR